MLNNTLESTVEKIPLTIFKGKEEASQLVARQIAAVIRSKNEQGQPAVLGLATGSSPLLIYRELVRMHQEDGLSFSNVFTFNLDEYYPMEASSKHSYHHFMYEHLFNHIDIKPENVFIPDGSIASNEIEQHCLAYEHKIESVGGIDLQLLGIGRSGHIGFNEPGSTVSTVTRLVQLDELTIEDAAKEFGGEENVPVNALTMGIKTILKARKILFVAWGEGKSDVLQKAIEGPVQRSVPASFLQNHPNVHFLIDEAAASKLSRFKTPWLTGVCEWDEKMKKRAVIWLSRKAKKPILKLTDQEYKKFGLANLVKTEGSAYNLNISVYNQIQRTITGWPGGKPNSDDTLRPERSAPHPKRVIVFSPHPDDDVISMGGTLLRLVEQGHDVHVAYQTSGNIAVFDDDARRFADFALAFSKKFDVAQEPILKLHNEVVDFLKQKEEDSVDNEQVLKIKGLIRQGEASAACRFCNVADRNIHFLDMPFYETGSVVKKPLGEEDIQIIINLLREVQPHQIFAAGDLQDPHGTHAVCLHAIMEAIDRIKNDAWMKDCYVWLYRGAWQEWDIEDIEMAVPISPEELMKKRKAIFKHQSQKDSPVYPGKDKREFWQRAEDRNRTTAKLYDELGLTEYEAIEAFKRYFF